MTTATETEYPHLAQKEPIEKQIDVIVGGPVSGGNNSSAHKAYARSIVEKRPRVTRDFISPLGTTTLPVTIREELRSKALMVSFTVVGLPLAYNAIIGQPTLNKLRTVVSTYHRVMKFPTKTGVVEAKSNPQESRQCYMTTTLLSKKIKTPTPNIDPEIRTKRPESLN
ncbi:hypothetical protein BHE74_00051973 [Ensete ventricosum]|nr:hypothetical protein BHE74_00051973 [Ensete ventricosum]